MISVAEYNNNKNLQLFEFFEKKTEMKLSVKNVDFNLRI